MSSSLIYLVLPALMLIAAIPLYLFTNVLIAVFAIVLSGITLVQTMKLLKRPGPVIEKKATGHDLSPRNHVFSSIDQLSAGIAHEINNPLGIIAQEIQWLRHIFKKEAILSTVDKKDLDDCEDSLNEISRQVDRCDEIVQKLLSLARQVEPVIQIVDANEIVLSVLEIVNREAKNANINIEAQFDNELPPISTDPPLLRQAILNLLHNARQAVGKDGYIYVRTRLVEPDFVEIEIRDHGCGIPPENLDRVFTPFFSTKPEGTGSGLGLAICSGIISRLGGKISVKSELAKYTAFTIQLPVAKKSERSLFI